MQYIQASGQQMLAGLLLVLAWQLAFLALLLFYNYTVTNKIWFFRWMKYHVLLVLLKKHIQNIKSV